MSTWIDRFVKMSPEERAMTVAEDQSTLSALVNEAALAQDWYRRWRLAREADPPTQPADMSAWLIEQDQDSRLAYWTGRVIDNDIRTPGQWSEDVNEARRFARRTDAECMLTWHCGGLGRVVEHLWMAPTKNTHRYLCACTCGCVGRTIAPGRCMACRVRESCRDLMTCEACAAGYRLASDGIHYDHNDSTWGVCRKVIASIRMDREHKRQRSENP